MFWEFTLRLLLAGVLGAVIGLDREYRAKEAGFRTHFLVSLGSALFMIVSQYGFAGVLGEAGVGLDPSRVAAQIVSGIGFLGAGTIIFQKQFVRGLTTAAGMWATAGIGMAVGGGMYWLGVSATVLTLAGLELLTVLFKNLGRCSSISPPRGRKTWYVSSTRCTSAVTASSATKPPKRNTGNCVRTGCRSWSKSRNSGKNRLCSPSFSRCRTWC